MLYMRRRICTCKIKMLIAEFHRNTSPVFKTLSSNSKVAHALIAYTSCSSSSLKIEVKVKLSLCLINYELWHEDVLWSEDIASYILKLGLRRFTPGERAPGTRWIGGWVTPQPVWTTWRTENSLLCRDSNSDRSVFQPVASRYTDYAICRTKV
jgi:hypothetical protein